MSIDMIRAFKMMIAALVMLAVAGCKMNLTADIYTTDLRDTAAGAEGLTAPGRLALQVPNADECAKHTAEIAAIMAGVVSDFSPKGCERAEMESFLLADIQMPFVTSESTWNASDSLFGIYVWEQEGDIGASIAMNLEKYGILAARLKEKFHQTVDLAASKVVLILNHDERKPIEVVAEGVFVNADPIPVARVFQLERRQRLEIRLSNVGTAYLAKQGIATGFALQTQ